MSFLPDTQTALVSQFQGSLNGVDSYDIDPSHGIWSQNVDFILGPSPNVASSGMPSVQCATRRGTSLVALNTYTTDGAILTIFSWFYSFDGIQACLIAMYSAVNGVRFYGGGTPLFSQIIIPVTGGAGASFVAAGTRLYAAFYDSTGRNGISQGYVYALFDATFGSPPAAVDTLFASPLPLSIATVTLSQPLSGVITAGTHRVGYVFITRTGDAAYVLNPVTSGGVFAPVSFTAPDGVHNLNVAIDFLSIPTYLTSSGFPPVQPTVQIVMSSAANPSEYYLVPGAIGNVPSSPGTVNIAVSITDGDLVTGTNVTQNQNLLTAINGSGPFNPSAIFSYSSRIGYVTIDASGFPVVYFSDQNNYQSLTAAFHGIYLEGRQIPVQGCSLGGLCYIATLAGLYATQDNGGLPGTWTPPARIDGSVGITSPTCMLATGGKLLLASEKGLYIYRGGVFPNIALSYWQGPDWSRINWLAPTQIQLVDDALDKVIRVLAPLKVFVTGASNTNPITITTAILINNAPIAYPHLFQTGLSVTISGVGGNTAANTTAVITVTGPNTFTIPVAGNGAYTSGGVAVPNAPNAQMCWAYPAGDSPGSTFYNLQAFSSYRASSIATVRNTVTGYDETWFGPHTSNTGGLVRRVLPTDANIYQDTDLSGNPSAIVMLNETSLLPGNQDENTTIKDFCAFNIRMLGSGSVNFTLYSLDHNPSLTVVPAASPFTISPTPGLEYILRFSLRNEQMSISFGTSSIGSWVVVSLIRAYYVNTLPQR